MGYKTERHERLLGQAREAYATHEISKQGDRRWLLQKRNSDGKWAWNMATEIVSLAGGQIYVGGDIDHVVFAYFSNSPDDDAKLRWMGHCDDVGYYVAQKARLGMGTPLVDVYEEEAARAEVKRWLAEVLAENAYGYDPHDPDEETIAGALTIALEDFDGAPFGDGAHALVSYLYEHMPDDFMYGREDVGQVLADRVYYTHAALRRLCDLLYGAKGSGVAAPLERPDDYRPEMPDWSDDEGDEP